MIGGIEIQSLEKINTENEKRKIKKTKKKQIH
jgi:hypothetical protein